MRKLIFAGSAALLLLTGCSESTTTVAKKEAEKPLEPVTGQSALFKMFQAARSWGGREPEVLKLDSLLLSEVPDVPRGKAAAWRASFVSRERSQSRSWTYSIIEGEGNLHKGLFAGLEEGWSGPRGVTTPFRMAAVRIDTDAAYKTALAEAGDYDKKNPGKPITFLLEKVNKHANPVWRVIWGESVGTSNFSIYVDASTGEFKEKLR
jgi:hypothetical protein